MIYLSADGLPSRFRLFRKGANETVKGTFIFDDEAARLVMTEFEKHGTDLMIDLEHLSLDTESRNYKPDALGWFKLAVENGELWAVDVRWNPEGTARLTDKTQRYTSPAFCTDKDNRIVSILNVALCAMPATRKPMPLVAASKSLGATGGKGMDELLKKLRAALKLADEATEDEIMTALAAKLAPPEEEKPEAEPEEEPEATAALSVRLTAQAKQIEALNAEIQRSKISELIALNIDKLAPTQEAWARSQSYETLSSFFEGAPSVHKRAHVALTNDAKTNELTPDEIRMCKLTGVSEEKFKKEKERRNGATH